MYQSKVLLSVFLVTGIMFTSGCDAQTQTPSGQDSLEALSKHVLSGGPAKDGIPPIEKPLYTTVEAANHTLRENDVVFLLETSEGTYIYPQRILVFHEIVNETVAGDAISVTYCPLVGAAVGFKGHTKHQDTTFGTSGKLVNSNLVMYDRATGSYWPQIFGKAINGPMKGSELESVPILWTTWGKAKNVYPGAKVLSEKTGHQRPYGRDPYGSYIEGTGYYSEPGLVFPVLNTDNRLNAKTLVTGVKVSGKTLAISKKRLEKEKVANLTLEKDGIVAIHDPSLDVVRVFSRSVDRQMLTFSVQDGRMVDQETRTVWSLKGKGLKGPLKGHALKTATFFDVMWFAWAAFYPETALYR